MESRRAFITTSVLTGLTLLAPSVSKSKSLEINFIQDKPKPIDLVLVKDFVISSHGNLQKVKELLEKESELVNATWDWGGGDFETGMNAAGHTGRVEIAEFLLSQGARMDIFCAAMLGKLDIVKSILDVYPTLKSSKGPHGLMLLHHATKGGENAIPVLNYLKEIGAS